MGAKTWGAVGGVGPPSGRREDLLSRSGRICWLRTRIGSCREVEPLGRELMRKSGFHCSVGVGPLFLAEDACRSAPSFAEKTW